jgi:subtilisin family serine protease
MNMLKLVSLSLLVMLMAGMVQAGTITPGLERQLSTMQNGDVVKVLVVMSQQADIRKLDWDLHDSKASMELRHHTVLETLRTQAKDSQGALLADLESNKASGSILGYTSHWIVNSVVVTGTVDSIRRLATRSDVERIEADLVVELIEPVESAKIVDKDAKGVGITPGVVAVGARRVWNELGIDGSGVVVGILDTGVDGSHVALTDRWRGNTEPVSECWLDAAQLGHATPQDTHGHGSHVMGTVTGLAEDDTIGVAPGAVWIASNIINADTGVDFDNGVIASLEFMADPDGDPLTLDDVPVVVQNSWGVNEGFTGYYDCDSRWWDAIDNCEAAGVVLTWSAGNEGPSGTSLRSPADRAASPTNCFSVGSTITSPPYTISDFSSRGPSGCGGEFAMKPEIVAPGSDIYSVQAGGGYTNKSGTSMAGPHLAGVVALMRASNPNVDVITVKEVLMNTAIDLGVAGEDNIYGHGFVDAYQAVISVMGGIGTVEGTITDSSTGLPIAGAQIRKVGAPNQAVTDANGFYSMTMPIGPADFTVNFFGYNEGFISVEIPEDATVNGDQVLVALPVSTLSGFVYGPDTNIVPGATVTVIDTPLPAAVADANGFYSLAVPSGVGNFYSVRSRFNGLGHQTQDIEMVGDLTLDFNLPILTAEDFESGDFSSYLWDQGTNPWIITSSNPYEGTYSAQSGTIGHNSSSQLSITMEIADTDLLSFYYKVDSEATYDFLRFYIDGVEEGEWSGSVAWTQFSISVDAGEHTFLWSYEKDGSVSSGADAGFIDFIEFPQQGTPGTPSMALDATSFDAQLAPEATEDQFLTVSNKGTAQLDYTINLVEGAKRDPMVSSVPFVELKKDELDTREGVSPLTGAGGPDVYGYSWSDSDEIGGPAYAWIDISGTGTAITASDDSNNGPYNLGFDFSYYGNTYDTVRVCSNGWLSFTSTSTAYSHQGIPNSAVPNNLLAAFWDDLNPASSGTIYYQAMGSQFIVQFDAVVHYNTSTAETFQIILNADGSIIYQYHTVSDGSACSVGMENDLGTDGLQVAFNSAYLHNDLAIRFATEPPLTWVTASPLAESVAAGQYGAVTVHFDATGLALGTYNAMMTVSSNDPLTGSVDVPITLLVQDSVSAVGDGLPNVLHLTGAVPNPFNPQTDIKFSLPRDAQVKLSVYDVSGRLVRSLLNESMTAGNHSVSWVGRDDAGKSVASGTYFMRLIADGETSVKSMVLVR